MPNPQTQLFPSMYASPKANPSMAAPSGANPSAVLLLHPSSSMYSPRHPTSAAMTSSAFTTNFPDTAISSGNGSSTFMILGIIVVVAMLSVVTIVGMILLKRKRQHVESKNPNPGAVYNGAV